MSGPNIRWSRVSFERSYTGNVLAFGFTKMLNSTLEDGHLFRILEKQSSMSTWGSAGNLACGFGFIYQIL
jgi:hypothetical protein